MPEGGPRGEFSAADTDPDRFTAITESKPREQSADFDASSKKAAENAAVAVVIEKILDRSINFATTEELRIALANNQDGIPEAEQERLVKIYGPILERRKAIELFNDEARNVRVLIIASEKSLIGDYTKLDDFLAEVEKIDPPPPEKLQQALLKQYELALNARAEVLANNQELEVLQEYKKIIENTLRSELDEDQVEDELDQADPELPQRLVENVRECARILSLIPSSTRARALQILENEDLPSSDLNVFRVSLTTAISRDRFPIPRDQARAAVSNLLANLIERNILNDISIEETASSREKLRQLTAAPDAPPQSRIAALESRINTVSASDTLKDIYRKLKNQKDPNFDAIFDDINRLNTIPNTEDLVEEAREIASRLELNRLESECEPFEEISAVSRITEQINVLAAAPERNIQYRRKEDELFQRILNREAASIRLSFGADSPEAVRARIGKFPNLEDQNEFRQEYQTYLAAENTERPNSGQEAEQSGQTKLNFAETEPEDPRLFDGDAEPDTRFISELEAGDLSGLSLTELNDRIDKLPNFVSGDEKFRLKKLAAREIELRELEALREEGRNAAQEACQIAERISQQRLTRSEIIRLIDENSFPPTIGNRLLELYDDYNAFGEGRSELINLTDQYAAASGIADRILTNAFTNRRQLERGLTEEDSLSVFDRRELSKLYDIIDGLPNAVRRSLAETGDATESLKKARLELVGAAREGDSQLLERLKPIFTAEDAIEFIRIKTRIANSIRNSPANALAEISIYTPRNESEQGEINRLRELALQRQLEDITDEILGILGSNDPDYGNVFIQLGKLSRLPASAAVNSEGLCTTIRSLATLAETDAIAYGLTPTGLFRDNSYESGLQSIEQDVPLRSDEYVQLATMLKSEALADAYASIELSFYLENANTILGRIARLPEDKAEQVQRKKLLFQEFVNFIATKRDERPEDFAITSSVEVSQVLQKAEYRPRVENLGINTKGFGIMKLLYRQSMGILVENFRVTKGTRKAMERIVPKIRNSEQARQGADTDERRASRAEANKFRRRVRNFAAQRALTPREAAYIKSIELSTAFNPLLVAAARADFGTTSAFVREALSERSRETKQMLRDGMHVPVLVIGGGPGGMASMDELMRKNPELAAQALLIDDADQIGGPFGVPRGPAWALNSASAVGDTEYIPDSSPVPEAESIRSGYADPTIGYPGERREANPDSRDFSINRTTSAGPSPEQIAPGRRYVTNEELEITNALEAAVLISNISFQTRLLEVTPAPTAEHPLRKKIRIEIRDEDGMTQPRTVEITNDLCIVSSGLGKETYGFETEGKQAETVLAESEKKPGVPQFGTYLKFFKALVDRTKSPEEKEPGEVVVIYGNGDSRRTMEEQLTRLFAEAGQNVARIKKIYVIANGEDSARPRYLARRDVQARGSRPSIITEIQGRRVGDVGFAEGGTEKLNVFDEDGEVFTDPNTGQPIIADHVVSTAGFKQTNEEIFAAYLEDGQRVRDQIDSVTLPGNSEVAVADKLKADPGVLFVQTASRPQFDEAKLRQLPAKSRAALLAVGPENAVAIDFRIHDTKAAVNNTLEDLGGQIERSEAFAKPQVIERSLRHPFVEQFEIPCSIDPQNYRVQDNADASRTASALLSLLMHKYEFSLPRARMPQNSFDAPLSPEFTDTVKLNMRLRQENVGSEKPRNYWEVSSAPASSLRGETPIPRTLATTLAEELQNSAFQSYCAELISSSRTTEPEITLALAFKNGRIQPAESYVE